MSALLRVSGVTAGYGSSTVLRDVSFDVEPGTVVSIMGRNGAGKTTLLKALMGLIPKDGLVELHGENISSWPGHRINRLGMVWVPQDDSVFPGLTVREHLAIAVHRKRIDAEVAAAADLFPVLGERVDQEAQTLSGGERKMLSIAQALVSKPRIVLMDEPTEGVAPVVVAQLMAAIEAATGTAAVVLVEQNIDTAVAVSSRGHVLENGQIVESGDIGQLHRDGVLEQRLTL